MSQAKFNLKERLVSLRNVLDRNDITVGLLLQLLGIAVSVLALWLGSRQFNINLQEASKDREIANEQFDISMKQADSVFNATMIVSKPMVHNLFPKLKVISESKDSIQLSFVTTTVNAGGRIALDVRHEYHVFSESIIGENYRFYSNSVRGDSEYGYLAPSSTDKIGSVLSIPVNGKSLNSIVNNKEKIKAGFLFHSLITYRDEILQKQYTWTQVAICSIPVNGKSVFYRIQDEKIARELMNSLYNRICADEKPVDFIEKSFPDMVYDTKQGDAWRKSKVEASLK